MQFEEAVSYLLSLGHETLAIKLGLRNIELLLERLDNPQQSFFSVQIAGTNGKGSTATMLDSITCAARIETGLFTSPHLYSITERIRINGTDISPDQFARCARQVRDAAESLLSESVIEALPTFFEQVTAIALLAFKRAGVELAILETGLGGRLDATTAVRAKVVAITPIALDHEQYLGQTITDIAAEKAAIIREGVSAIIAPQSKEALSVILARAKQCKVEPSVDECEIKIESVSAVGQACASFMTKSDAYEGVCLSLLGRHQIVNASVAIRLAETLRQRGFEIAKEAIIEGLQRARHPGRLEFFPGQPALLLDGAHNPSGALALRQYLDEFVSVPITMVFGAMSDKRLGEMAELLFPAASRLILTQPDNPRSADVGSLRNLAERYLGKDQILTTTSSSDALRLAQELTPSNELICVAGSLYLIGEVRTLNNLPQSS